jgi:rhodanese-related sulfurtransferase
MIQILKNRNKMKKIVIIIISVVLLSSCNSKEGITQDGVNQNCEASVVPKDDLVNLLYSKNLEGVRFIDIRTPHQYAMGHLPNAINMPMNDFFNIKEFEKINKDDILILYGNDTSSPKMLALMAGHFTNSKFYIAGGGYDFINNKILNGLGYNSGVYDDEVPLVDFQKAVNEIKSRAGANPGTVKKSKPASSNPIVKRKKKEVSGGGG